MIRRGALSPECEARSGDYMELLRKKHEPQPANHPAEPPGGEASHAPPEPTSQADTLNVSQNSPAEALPALLVTAISEQAPAAQETTAAETASQQERHLRIAIGIGFRGEITGCDHLVIDGVVEGEIKDVPPLRNFRWRTL